MKKTVQKKSKKTLINYRNILLLALLSLAICNKSNSQQVSSKNHGDENKVSANLKQTVGPTRNRFLEMQQSIAARNKLNIQNKQNIGVPVFKGKNPGNNNIVPVNYVFKGNGQWNNPTNWVNATIPPDNLQNSQKIIISENSRCLFNDSKIFLVEEGDSIEIEKGAALYVSIGNNLIFRGGTLTNNGMLSIVSGKLSDQATKSSIINRGEFKTNDFSQNKEVSKIQPHKDLHTREFSKIPERKIN